MGGVVGGVGGISALCFAFWYFIIRRKVKQFKLPQSQKPHPLQRHNVWQEPKELPANNNRELDATQSRQELGTQSRQELGS